MVNVTFFIEDDKVMSKITSTTSLEVVEVINLTGNIDFLGLELSEKKSLWDFDKIGYFENEILFHFYIKYVGIIDNFFQKYNVEKISFEGEHEIYPFIKGYCLPNKNIKFNRVNFYIKYVKNFIGSIFTLCVSNVYLFIVLLFGRKNSGFKTLEVNKRFALIHSRSSFKKIFNICKNDILYYYDSITLKEVPNGTNVESIFSVLSYTEKVYFLLKLMFNSSVGLKDNYKSSKVILGKYNASLTLLFLSKRISHFLLIKECYKKILKHSKSDQFYSGERESRYGKLAMDLRSNIESIAIPHGMAYSYDYPLGIFGDTYYATSMPEKLFLEKLYKDKTILFAEDVLTKMFFVGYENGLKKEKEVIFFTEPRRIEVNIEILNILLKNFNNIRVKLHPSDSKGNYSMFNNINYIEDFNESISNNICLARKSTILIEALYNNSNAMAILIDEKDKFDFNNTFPSLKDERILRVESFDELKEIMKKHA